MANQTFSEQDQVQFKFGGPKMWVEKVHEGQVSPGSIDKIVADMKDRDGSSQEDYADDPATEVTSYECVWFTKDGIFQRANFKPDWLIPALEE